MAGLGGAKRVAGLHHEGKRKDLKECVKQLFRVSRRAARVVAGGADAGYGVGGAGAGPRVRRGKRRAAMRVGWSAH